MMTMPTDDHFYDNLTSSYTIKAAFTAHITQMHDTPLSHNAAHLLSNEDLPAMAA